MWRALQDPPQNIYFTTLSPSKNGGIYNISQPIAATYISSPSIRTAFARYLASMLLKPPSVQRIALKELPQMNMFFLTTLDQLERRTVYFK